MNEYYELLGLSESATDEEITRRYEELKAKYKEDRWLDGEAGNEAAKMLTKLETAYREITASRKEQSKNTDGENTVEMISALIKEGKSTRRKRSWTIVTSVLPSGIICKRSCSIKRIGRTRARNSWKSLCKWTLIT